MKRLSGLGLLAAFFVSLCMAAPLEVAADSLCYGPNTLLGNWPGQNLPSGLLTYPLCNSSGQLTTSGSGGGGGGTGAPLPGSGNTAAAANQSIGIQALNGGNMVPLQETTAGALNVNVVAGGGGGAGAPLPGNANTAVGANQGVGVQAVVGGNYVPLSGTGTSLNENITGGSISNTGFAVNAALPTGTNTIGAVNLAAGAAIANTSFGIAGSLPAGSNSIGSVVLATGTNAFGSIANTAFGITGSLPTGSNTIGAVNLTGAFPTAYTPGAGASGVLGVLGDIVDQEINQNSYLSAIVTNTSGNTYTSNSLNVNCTAGCSGGTGGGSIPQAATGTSNTTAANVQGATGGIPVGVGLPYSMTADNQTATAASGVGLMGWDGTNMDRLSETAGVLNVGVTNTPTVLLGAGTNNIGNVAIGSGKGFASGTPLFVQCTSGCSGSGGGGSNPATWTTEISSSSSSPICPGGTTSAPGTCTIMSMSVGCIAGSATTCTGALAQNNIGGIFDAASTTAACIGTGTCETYPFGSLGGSTGYQTVQPWGSSGYTCQTGCVVAAGSGFSAGVVLFISGHT